MPKSNTPITLSADPAQPLEAATKQYVDSKASTPTNWGPLVRVAATDPFFSLASPGASIDGVTMTSADRVLVTSLLSAQNNGIYVWNGAAVPMTRAADADTWTEIVGAVVAVEQGTTFNDTIWQCTADRGGTLGTTTQQWRRLRGLIRVEDEGFAANADTATINFKGAGVVAGAAGTNGVDVTVSGAPTGAAGGALSGTYPNPTLASPLTAGTPSAPTHVATKDYVDTGLVQKSDTSHVHAGLAPMLEIWDEDALLTPAPVGLRFKGEGVAATGGTDIDITIPGVPTGCMMMWPVATPPTGWLLCDGLAIPAQHTALIALVGANTPNMTGRFPLGAGVSLPSGTTRTLGVAGGADERTLTTAQMPAHSHAHTHTINHNHTLNRNVADGTSSITYRAGFNDGNNVSGSNVIDAHAGSSGAATAHANGSGDPHPTIGPFLAVNFIIKF